MAAGPRTKRFELVAVAGLGQHVGADLRKRHARAGIARPDHALAQCAVRLEQKLQRPCSCQAARRGRGHARLRKSGSVLMTVHGNFSVDLPAHA